MNVDIIPTFDNQKVVGIKMGGIEIPFRNQILFQEFVDIYYEPLKILLPILDFSKISGEFRTEWTDEELYILIKESNHLQVMILNMLRVNGSLTRGEILPVLRQIDKHNYENLSARQLGPQIGGIRIRVKNMKKEDLIHIDSKNQRYSFNEKYSKRIKAFLIEALEEYDKNI